MRNMSISNIQLYYGIDNRHDRHRKLVRLLWNFTQILPQVSQAKMCTKISFNKYIFYRHLSCFLFSCNSLWAFRCTILASIACDSQGWIISQECSWISIMRCPLQPWDEEYIVYWDQMNRERNAVLKLINRFWTC